VDLLISILPFEKEFYRKEGFERVEYAGNPVAADARPSLGRAEFRKKHSIAEDAPLVALLPGSRKVEIERILPEMLKAARIVCSRSGNVRFVVPLARSRSLGEFGKAAAAAGLREDEVSGLFTVVSGETYDAVAASDAAAVASGTATLETAVLGTPLVVVYKASALNYFLLRPLISIDTFGLVNLVAGKRLAVELIQNELEPERLADEILKLLDPQRNSRMREDLAEVREVLAGEDPSKRAAALIMSEIVKEGGAGDR
jgi:lipid-A-disaccharide synthase